MNKEFWQASLIRCARTIAQTAVSVIGTTAFVLSDVNWGVVVSASLLSGLLSILTSIATGLPEVDYARYLHNELEGDEDPEDDEIEEVYYDD